MRTTFEKNCLPFPNILYFMFFNSSLPPHHVPSRAPYMMQCKVGRSYLPPGLGHAVERDEPLHGGLEHAVQTRHEYRAAQ